MASKSAQKLAWELAGRQHWVIARRQLLAVGFTSREIDLRIEDGRLHPIHAGVYSVGRPELPREGYFLAAVLACGDSAALSHASAAELWEIRPSSRGAIHVSLPAQKHHRPPRIKVHRRTAVETTTHKDIAVTTPVCTIVDAATYLSDERLERAMNEAFNRDLVDPEQLRSAVDALAHRRGARRVCRLLDRDTFAVTATVLEQRFLPIARRAGLPRPQTQVQREGGRVDFYFAELGLIVEADSLRFHRTPSQQRSDRLRDQKHLAVGLTTLRFTHHQIFHEPDHVAAILSAVANNLAPAAP